MPEDTPVAKDDSYKLSFKFQGSSKAELMKDNKFGDGKMFKLDFDPRVIDNKILPGGTKKLAQSNLVMMFFYVVRSSSEI